MCKRGRCATCCWLNLSSSPGVAGHEGEDETTEYVDGLLGVSSASKSFVVVNSGDDGDGDIDRPYES